MRPYISIFAEESKPKIVTVKSNKGVVYKVANFPAILGKDFTKFISQKNLDSYAINSNTIASDVYFCIVEKKSTIQGTISVVCGKTEFVRYISDEITLDWMVKTGSSYVGTSQDDSGRIENEYKFKPEKGLKWFKDVFFNKGFITVGDYFKEDAYSIGESEYSINNYLEKAVVLVEPDVEAAKSFSASKPTTKTKQKSVKVSEEEVYLRDNLDKFNKPDKSADNKFWNVYEVSGNSWGISAEEDEEEGRYIPTIQQLVSVSKNPKLSKQMKGLIVWSSDDYKNFALAFDFKNNKIVILPKKTKLKIDVTVSEEEQD